MTVRHAYICLLILVLGVAADIGHINTKSNVIGYHPGEEAGLENSLKGAQIVLIPAGVPRKPGMTRDGIKILWMC